MDNIKNIGLGVLLVLSIVFGVQTIKKPTVITIPVPQYANTGATPGSEFYNPTAFYNPATFGGTVQASSTVNSAETMLASTLINNVGLDYTLNVQAATLTLPASTTLQSFVPKVGDTRNFFIRNATTTATNLTIAGATGVLLKKATTTAVIFGDTDGANYGLLKFVRKANKDIEVIFESITD